MVINNLPDIKLMMAGKLLSKNLNPVHGSSSTGFNHEFYLAYQILIGSSDHSGQL
jgi:hypothetical protein